MSAAYFSTYRLLVAKFMTSLTIRLARYFPGKQQPVYGFRSPTRVHKEKGKGNTAPCQEEILTW